MLYRKKHTRGRIHRIKPKSSIFKSLWFWFLLLGILIVLVICYFLFLYSGFQLKNIVISGNDKIKAKELEEIIWDNSSTDLLNILNIKISTRNIFLINTENIKKEILEKFSVIESVETSKKLPQTLTIKVAERKPFGVFCPPSSMSGCYLMDNKGIAFEKVTSVQDSTFIVRQMSVNGKIISGEKVVAQNIINAISKIEENLKENFQIDIKEVFVTTSIRLNIKTSEGWQIYFDLGSTADIISQLLKLKPLLSSEISLADRANLRYIDLRPKDRAIVCDNAICGG